MNVEVTSRDEALKGRVCTKCGQAKGFESFSPAKGYAGGLRSECKICTNERARAYNTSPQGRAVFKRFRESHRESQAAQSRCRRAQNSEKTKRLARELRRKNIEALTDHYVKKTIAGDSGLSLKLIDDSMVTVKRQQLRLRRLVREIKQAIDKESK